MHTLLLALLSKANFERYGELTRAQLKTDELKEVLRAIEVLHEKTEEDLTINDLILGLRSCYPDKKAENLIAVVKTWKDVAFNPELVAAYFDDATKKARAYEIALAGIDCFEGRKTWDEFSQSLGSVDQIIAQPDFEFVSHNLLALKSHQEAKGGFQWRLNSLNRMLGHLPKRTFGFVFARPDTGKTGLLASEITNFAVQTDQNILWIANEEDAATVRTRCFQALYGVTEAKLYANAEKYNEHYQNKIGDRLMISGDVNINTKAAIERALKRHKPAILVVDQLDKVRGFKADREDLRVGQAYQWMRRMCNEYDLAGVGVTQANSTAEGKKYLRMTDIADSHTSKAAEADWILGIGKIHDNEDSRFLHTPKDKLPMSEGKEASKRHGYAEVHFKPDIARYEDYA